MQGVAATERLFPIVRNDGWRRPWLYALGLSLALHAAGAAMFLPHPVRESESFEPIEVEITTEDDLARQSNIPADIPQEPARDETKPSDAAAIPETDARPPIEPPASEKPAPAQDPLEPAEAPPPEPRRATFEPPQPAQAAAASDVASEAATGRATKAFLAAVSAELNRRRIYPAAARERGIVGATKIAFKIGPAGRVTTFRILQSSGHALLDDAVARIMESIRAPAPPNGDFDSVVTIRFGLK